MTDERANIKVSREWYEKHKQQKDAGQTWEEYLDGQAPETLEAIEQKLDQIQERDTQGYDKYTLGYIKEQVEQLESSGSTGDNSEVLEEIEKLKRIVDNLPERTAEKFGDRYR